jgi:DNA gyrase subunit A
MDTREEDFVERLFVASTHATILFLTNKGRVHWMKVYELPQLGRAARGKALVNRLQRGAGERVQGALPGRQFDDGGEEYVLIATRRGVIKKTPLQAYANPRRGGIIALNLEEGDEVIGAALTTGSQEVILATRRGKSIRFPESQVRPMGRTATGVWGIRLQEGDEVVGMEILSPGATILTVTARGYGKRTPLEHYRVQNRGGQGIITIRTSARNGDVVGILQVVSDDQVMLITDGGQVLRCRVSGISTMGRATQGVRLMDLDANEKLVSVARLAEREDAGDTREVVPAEVEPDSEAESDGELELDARAEGEPELETDPTEGDEPAGPDGDEEE